MEPTNKQRLVRPVPLKTEATPTAQSATDKPNTLPRKSFLSVLNSLQAELEHDELPELARVTRRQAFTQKEMMRPEVKKILEEREAKKPHKASSRTVEREQNDVRSNKSSLNNKRTSRKRGVSDSLEKLEVYLKANHEARLKQMHIKDDNENKEAKGDKEKRIEVSLKGLEDIINSFIKLDVLSHFNKGRLLKTSLLSTVVLLIQFAVSKRARKWLLLTVNILVYILGISLSSGAFALWILKVRSDRKKLREQTSNQNGAQNQEQREGQPHIGTPIQTHSQTPISLQLRSQLRRSGTNLV